MKNTTKSALSLRAHSIRDLTADDLRLVVGGRSGHAGSGSGSGSGGHAASGSGGSFGHNSSVASS